MVLLSLNDILIVDEGEEENTNNIDNNENKATKKSKSLFLQLETILKEDPFMLFLSSFFILISSLISLYCIPFGPLAILIITSITALFVSILQNYLDPIFMNIILLVLQGIMWSLNYYSRLYLPINLFHQKSINPHYPIISDISFFIELSTVLLFFIFMYLLFYHFYFVKYNKDKSYQLSILLVLLFDLLLLFYFSIQLQSFILFFTSLLGITIFLFQMLEFNFIMNILLNYSLMFMINYLYKNNLFQYFNYFKLFTNFIFGPFGILLSTIVSILGKHENKNFETFVLFTINLILLYLSKRLNNISMFFVGLFDIATYIVFIGMKRLKGNGEFLLFLVIISGIILGIVLNYHE